MDKKTRFNQIFDGHYDKVFRICKGYYNGNEALAADTTQDIFIKIWESLDAFKDESSISTWIYRISVNTCLMYLRKVSTKREQSTAEFPTIIAEPYSKDYEEKLKKMYGCIQTLDEKDRMIMLMILEGIEYADISAVIGLSEDTLRVRIHRIKKNLKQCVQDGNI